MILIRKVATLGSAATLLALVGCGFASSDSREPPVAEGSTETVAPNPIDAAALPPSAAAPACPTPPVASSDIFSTAAGTFAAHILGVSAAERTLQFDVVSSLIGDAASEAFRKRFPGETAGPPNDYWISNEDEELRSAGIDASARVLLIDYEQGVEPRENNVEQLATSFSPDEVYWLTFQSGQIIAVCHQYRP